LGVCIMKTYARIDGGKVAEIFSTDGNMGTMFHPSIVWADVSAGAVPQVGMIATQTGSAWTFAVPAGPTLAQNQAVAWEKIKAERTRRKNGGVQVTVTAAVGATPAVTKWFHSDTDSRIQQLGLIDMGANIPANLQWKTMDGTFVTMTQALAQAVMNAQASADQANFSNAETHRTNMMAAADPTTYSYSASWTAIYA
jgi:hypothetical protein